MSASAALTSAVVSAPAYGAIERALTSPDERVGVSGLTGPAAALALSVMTARAGRGILLVVRDDAAMSTWQRDLAAAYQLLGRNPRGIVPFPTLIADPYNNIPPHAEIERERVRALGRLRRKDVEVLLVPAPALLGWLPSP